MVSKIGQKPKYILLLLFSVVIVVTLLCNTEADWNVMAFLGLCFEFQGRLQSWLPGICYAGLQNLSSLPRRGTAHVAFLNPFVRASFPLTPFRGDVEMVIMKVAGGEWSGVLDVFPLACDLTAGAVFFFGADGAYLNGTTLAAMGCVMLCALMYPGGELPVEAQLSNSGLLT